MSEILVNRTAIKKFIREGLGCTCPDEVFESISIEQNPRVDDNLSVGYLLRIGGKLLVYLVEPHEQASLTGSLEQIFHWGRELRDAGEFNRFRLVVSTPDIQPTRQKLLHQFAALDVLDERLHLHVITPDQLPDLH